MGESLDGIITSWNESAEHLYGYPAAEIVGKSVMTLIPPDRHDEEHGILELIRKGERISHFATVRRRKAGT